MKDELFDDLLASAKEMVEIELSEKDADDLLAWIDNPPPINDALQRAIFARGERVQLPPFTLEFDEKLLKEGLARLEQELADQRED